MADKTKQMDRRTAPPLRNGLDVAALRDLRARVVGGRQHSQLRYHATSQWVRGAYSRTTFGTPGDTPHDDGRPVHVLNADQPHLLCGGDEGPSPLETLLHALACCLIGEFVGAASERGLNLTEVRAVTEGRLDLRRSLGLGGPWRGFSDLRVTLEVCGDIETQTLSEVLDEARARSVVLDLLTGGTHVQVEGL